MTKLTVRHRTTYSYRREVELAPHRLMLRPREGRDLRLLIHEISTAPSSEVSWSTDVFGNAVAAAAFRTPADMLVIDSFAEVDLTAPAWPIFNIAASGATYPFRYSEDEWTDLGALAVRQYPDPFDRLEIWARGFVAGSSTDTLSLLLDLNAGISLWISYQSRDDEGTQSPGETLDRGWGSCRDLAVLFAEASRCLGFGARIVSGYLFNPVGGLEGSPDRGSTHAWAEVFVPGAGWIPFDPTNRKMGGENLIPVAISRDISQVVPVAGSFVGPSDAFASMQVDVEVLSGNVSDMSQAKNGNHQTIAGE
ncbi:MULTISPECIES: transglutaminase family protein [Rhizobium]|uniref:transglutaminase family protein n=1 Tax=Rhizobium terrae TaxID=2171756 RepID=UPI000E3C66FE|nr:transglutaminase family protein [Rhizobium terrae]